MAGCSADGWMSASLAGLTCARPFTQLFLTLYVTTAVQVRALAILVLSGMLLLSLLGFAARGRPLPNDPCTRSAARVRNSGPLTCRAVLVPYHRLSGRSIHEMQPNLLYSQRASLRERPRGSRGGSCSLRLASFPESLQAGR